MSGTQSLNLLLDLYQQSRTKGEWASLYMETKNGKDAITFRIGSLHAGYTARSETPVNQCMKRKTPSQRRRDEKRKAEFLAKKTVDPTEASLNNKNANASDHAKVLLVEPKDEINLEEPEVKQTKAETEVNILGEFVFDTKLQKVEINETFWKSFKDNFKDGVEEFWDGSLCNEKIIIFWGNVNSKKDLIEILF